MSRRRRRLLVALGVAVLGLGGLAAAVAMTPLAREAGSTSADLLLRGARVVDALHPEPRHVDVVIRDGRIAELAPAGTAEVGSDVGILDAHGAFVAPGLVDAHTHMLRAGYCGGDEGVAWANVRQIPMNFDVALASGLTTVVDLGGPLHGVLAIRDALAADDGVAPRYLVAGPVLTAAGGYPLDWADEALVTDLVVALQLGDEADAQVAVAQVAEAGVDVVKIAWMDLAYNERPLPTLPDPVFRAAVVAAHDHGLRVFVHAHSASAYRAALAAGADVIAHSAFDRLPDEVVAEVARRKIPVIPTLWVFASFDAVDGDPAVLHEVRDQLVPEIYEAVEDFDHRARAGGDLLPDDFLPGLRKHRVREAIEVARDNLRRLADAGAVIAFGTDTSFCYAHHGAAHRELAELVRAGLTPAQAFRAATLGSATALGREDLGRVAVGAPADLLVLEHDPLQRVDALAHIQRVIVGGRVVPSSPPEPPGVTRTLRTLTELVPALYL